MSAKAIEPARSGDTTQLAAICPTLPHATASTEIPTAAKPTMAPTMECVVETGHPLMLAIRSHVAAASSADSMPNTSNSGVSVSTAGSMIPLRFVEVTSPPARYTPANSKIAAMMMACFNVRALEPTEVPMAFATSFAPIPQAMKRPNTQASVSSIKPCDAMISILDAPILALFQS